MTDETPTSEMNRCPSCGALLDRPGASGLCPACLMSGVLRADAATVSIVGERETEGMNRAALHQERSQRRFELPHTMGNYTLVAPLGQGGMGAVYEAVQESTGRRLAVKLLAQELDSSEMRQRFLREGRLAARVNHRSSLYVYGSEEIDGVPVITMEIAAGGTLQDALDRRGRFGVQEAVDAVLNMIDGLEAALDRGVLHRDIKPSNCFVSPDGTVQVGDFGLSVSTLPSADSFMTQTGKVMGTPAFASPEQLRGDEVDHRSDIYAVGATLFTLLTDRAPFEGKNAVQIVANVIDSPPADVGALRDDLPGGLGQVIARCLAKEPAGRFGDYEALRNALLPYSSVVPEPAMQSQRTAAGWIDYLAAFLPVYAAMMILVGPENLFIRPLYSMSFEAWQYHLLVFGVGFAYFAVTEGLWGAGLGKWVMNLRVVTQEGRCPGILRALLRIVIPIAAIESVRVPLSVATLPAGEWSSLNFLVFTGLAIFSPWIAALLWLPARRSNGFAASWDLLTGTRVVVRPTGSRRPAEGTADRAAAGEQAGAVEGVRRLGPFEVSSEIIAGEWLAGEDPVLRRPVWLIRREDQALSEARLSIARPGRARWLQELHADGVVWEAFQADQGAPVRAHLEKGPVAWSTLRFWLHDLAAEMRAAERDGTSYSSCSLDQVWITEDGRAMLLDRPWPQDGIPADSISVDSLEGQQAFLRLVADQVDPLSVPLHARPVLENLRSGSFEKLTFLVGTLQGILSKPADMRAGLRGASLLVIPGYATVATLLGIAANTDPSVDLLTWAGRIAIAVLVMMHFMAMFDFILACAQKSTGLTTFGLEAVTERGRASRKRLLVRSAIQWLPVVLPTLVLGVIALKEGQWIPFEHAAILGTVASIAGIVVAASALLNPTRGLHDRLAGVWIGRR